MNYNKYTFFWHGVFSQWYPCKFMIDGITYNCAEQYMMAEKARLFKDETILQSILSTSDPKEQKSLGRLIKNFDPKVWDNVCKDVVKRGNIAKFTQNPELLVQLLKTKNTLLAEASPYDTIWGIGLKESDPLANDISQWRGKNYLGYILTEIRDSILQGY